MKSAFKFLFIFSQILFLSLLNLPEFYFFTFYTNFAISVQHIIIIIGLFGFFSLDHSPHISVSLSPVAEFGNCLGLHFSGFLGGYFDILASGAVFVKWVVPQISVHPSNVLPLRQKRSSSSELRISVQSFRVLMFCFHWEFSAIPSVISMIVEISGPSVSRCVGMSHDYGERMKTHRATCDKSTFLNGAPAIFFSPLSAHSSLIIPLRIVSLVINPELSILGFGWYWAN